METRTPVSPLATRATGLHYLWCFVLEVCHTKLFCGVIQLLLQHHSFSYAAWLPHTHSLAPTGIMILAFVWLLPLSFEAIRLPIPPASATAIGPRGEKLCAAGMTRRDTALASLTASNFIVGRALWAPLHVRNAAVDVALLAEGDSLVRSIWLQRLAYPALLASLETGLFEALDIKPLKAHALCERLDIDSRALEALTSTCCGLGLLESTPDGFAITPAARPLLLTKSPYYFGAQLLAADGTQASLRRALSRRANRRVEYTALSRTSVHSFIASMEAHSRVTAECTAAAVDLCQGQRLLDMAGGSGCFARAFVRANRHLQATIADVADVIQLHDSKHNTYVETDVRDRIETAEADLFDANTWPRNHDVVLLANVLHDWSPAEAAAILRNAYAAITSGGLCIIVEVLMNEERTGPLTSGLYSVSMLLGDWRTGKQYSESDLFKMLQNAHFANVTRGPNCGNFHTALLAYKL